MLEKTGIADAERVREKFPPVERIDRGPVAVVECYERIPCNPCATACRVHAIEIGGDLALDHLQVNRIDLVFHRRPDPLQVRVVAGLDVTFDASDGLWGHVLGFVGGLRLAPMSNDRWGRHVGTLTPFLS